jgi:disintegrin and metalloproteinase domain-containing protein 10
VDPSGPLATLRKILLSDKSIASLKKFLTDHWYAAVLAVIAVVGLMVSYLIVYFLSICNIVIKC